MAPAVVEYEPLEYDYNEAKIVVKSEGGVLFAEHEHEFNEEEEANTNSSLSSTWFAVIYGGLIGSIGGSFLLNPIVGACLGAVAAGVGTKAADYCVAR